jgi:hypothetical protein
VCRVTKAWWVMYYQTVCGMTKDLVCEMTYDSV